jgi:cell division protein FtsQ
VTFGLTLTKRGRRVLRLVPLLALLLVLAGAGWLWFRDSGLVRVRQVEVIGLTESDGQQVRVALIQAAQEMTTLHVRPGVLRDAVAQFPSVERISARADFPHRLTIRVTEERPVAALASDSGSRVAVTGTGIVLRGVTVDRDLPSLRGTAIGPRLTDPRLLGALRVAGAAPEPLLHRTDELTLDGRGVVVALSNGPQLVFGNGADVRAKWAAAAAVLADRSAAGAAYLDLRVPGRVAAGGLAPVTDSNAQVQPQNSPTLNQG